MKRLNTCFAWTCYCLLWSTSTAGAADALDGVAANVNGYAITRSELRNRMEDLGQKNDNRLAVLQNMIEERLVQEEIERRGLAATQQEITAAINKVKQQNYVRTDAELKAKLKEQGLTFETFRESLKEQIERSKFVSYVMGAKIKISDQDIKSYYRQRFSDSKGIKRYKISNIYVKASVEERAARKTGRQRADLALQEIKSGKGFASVAKKRSDGPTAAKGGLLGEFVEGELRPWFFEKVRGLRPGEQTDVITTNDGFYIFRLESISHAPPPDFAEMKEQLQRQLYNEELDRYFRIWIREAKKKGLIKIHIPDGKTT